MLISTLFFNSTIFNSSFILISFCFSSSKKLITFQAPFIWCFSRQFCIYGHLYVLSPISSLTDKSNLPVSIIIYTVFVILLILLLPHNDNNLPSVALHYYFFVRQNNYHSFYRNDHE